MSASLSYDHTLPAARDPSAGADSGAPYQPRTSLPCCLKTATPPRSTREDAACVFRARSSRDRGCAWTNCREAEAQSRTWPAACRRVKAVNSGSSALAWTLPETCGVLRRLRKIGASTLPSPSFFRFQLLALATISVSSRKLAASSRRSFDQPDFRAPNIAVPIRTHVDPSSMAIS